MEKTIVTYILENWPLLGLWLLTTIGIGYLCVIATKMLSGYKDVVATVASLKSITSSVQGAQAVMRTEFDAMQRSNSDLVQENMREHDSMNQNFKEIFTWMRDIGKDIGRVLGHLHLNGGGKA